MNVNIMTNKFEISRRSFIVSAGVTGLTAKVLFAESASAQSDFPTKPLTMYISFALEGSSGKVGQLLGAKMQERLGQAIGFKGHPGGLGGSIAAEAAAKVAPDGYIMLMGTVGNITLLPNIYKGYAINPLKDFIPITQVTFTPDVLIAHPSAPYNTFDEFVKYAKANPGAIHYSQIAPGSIHRMEFESIIASTGIKLTLNDKVTSSDNAMKALADGTIQVAMTTVPYVLPVLQSGKAKALALASDKLSAQLPRVPLFKTVGVADIPYGSWNGLFVPTGTPRPIVDKLFDAIKYAAEDPGVKTAIEAMGMYVNISESPDAFRAFLEAETARFGAIAQKAAIVIQ
jgi:tripartite-type tricarboxylate transporter receptor subunit TctC